MTDEKFISDEDAAKVTVIVESIAEQLDECENPLHATLSTARCLVQAALAQTKTRQVRDKYARAMHKFIFGD